MTDNLGDLRLIILSGNDQPAVRSASEELMQFLHEASGIQLIGTYGPNEAVSEEIEFDMVVVVGGDGSMLRGCRQLGMRQRPMIGVNLGRLGFLTDLSPVEFRESLNQLRGGQYQIIKHVMLECCHTRANGEVFTDLGLNEVTITSAGSLKMLDICLQIDGEAVTTFSCDGLILSTPVGSTAHNLSAGGPILRQDLEAFVITPICPHTLTVRPIVDASSRTYALFVPEAPEGVQIVIDGQIHRSIASNDRIIIRRAEQTFQLVRLFGHSYYGTLHRKLGWQGQLEYRERRGR